jgi:hypothetical protein
MSSTAGHASASSLGREALSLCRGSIAAQRICIETAVAVDASRRCPYVVRTVRIRALHRVRLAIVLAGACGVAAACSSVVTLPSDAATAGGAGGGPGGTGGAGGAGGDEDGGADAGPDPDAPLWWLSLGTLVSSTAFDAAGNLWVAGQFQGTTDLGGGTVVSAGGTDLFLAQFSPEGEHLWSRGFGGAGDEDWPELQIAVDGTLTLAVHTESPNLDLGGPALDANGKLALARLDGSGSHVWSQRLAFSESLDFSNPGLAVTASGAVVLAPFEYYGVLLEKRGSTGELIWDVPIPPGPSLVPPLGRQVSACGEHVTLLAWGSGPMDLGAGEVDGAVIVARYDADGALLWSSGFGDNDEAYPAAVDCNPSGHVTLGGALANASVDFGGGAVGSNAPGGLTSSFLVQLDADGSHRWSLAMEGVFTWNLVSSSGPSAAIAVAGVMNPGSATPDGGAATTDRPLLAMFTPTGLRRERWILEGDGRGLAAALAPGRAVLAGVRAGPLDLGGGIVVNDALEGVGIRGFVAVYAAGDDGP